MNSMRLALIVLLSLTVILAGVVVGRTILFSHNFPTTPPGI